MADSSSGGGSGLTLLLPLVLIVGMIWFMSRSQRKQKAKQAATVAALGPGSTVITTSGQLGTVEAVEDDYVLLEIAPGVSVRFVKQAIGRVIEDPATADEAGDVETADEAERDVSVQDDSPAPESPQNPTHTEK